MVTPRHQPGPSRGTTLEQIRTILDASPVPTAILRWDRILYINPAGSRLLGDEEAENILYRSILGFSDSGQSEEARRKRIHSLMDRGETVSILQKRWISREGKWIQRDGGTIVVEVQAWEIPLAGGNGTQLTFQDVTASVAAEQQRSEAEEQLRLAIDAAQIGTWDYEPATGKLRCSRRCNEIFGLSWNGELDYAAFLNLLHPEDRARTDRAVQQSFDPEGNGEFGCDYRLLCPEGEVRWIAAKGRAFSTIINGRRQATRLIGTALDITNLRQTDASLRQNEKLAATGRLAATIAHEINNPLEAITNLLYLLEDGSLPEEQRKYLRLAQQELARVVDIATQTLRFYRDPSPPKVCNLTEVIESVLTFFGARITSSHIQIERRFDERASVLGAREELRQVIVNLVRNAMEAMPHGGKLQVRTKGTSNRRTGRKGVRLTIADTGHGMDHATKRRMFEPFFTTKAGVGIGLGLWLSAGIIQQHGGAIRMKSRRRPGHSGTVFSIFLPLDRRR
ncbi:MAG: ATP-binding protein [Acidobacteriaceae bacterium]